MIIKQDQIDFFPIRSEIGFSLSFAGATLLSLPSESLTGLLRTNLFFGAVDSVDLRPPDVNELCSNASKRASFSVFWRSELFDGVMGGCSLLGDKRVDSRTGAPY